MSLSLHDIAVPELTRLMNSLAAILNKAETYAKEKGVDVTKEYFEATLYEDMKSLAFQVQFGTYSVNKWLSRSLPDDITAKYTDDAKTWDDLKTRVQKQLEILKTVNKEAMNASISNTYEMNLGPVDTQHISVLDGFQKFAQPTIYFHVVTAYNILRSKGVPLGKTDYLESFLMSK